jgi:hypothetical protein
MIKNNLFRALDALIDLAARHNADLNLTCAILHTKLSTAYR